MTPVPKAPARACLRVSGFLSGQRVVQHRVGPIVKGGRGRRSLRQRTAQQPSSIGDNGSNRHAYALQRAWVVCAHDRTRSRHHTLRSRRDTTLRTPDRIRQNCATFYSSPARDGLPVAGLSEIAGGIGLLIPALRRAAAWGLVALLVAVFPANVYMAMEQPNLLLWGRLPLQIVLIWWVLWCTRPMSENRIR